MRNRQRFAVLHVVTREDQIEVERARRSRIRTLPAEIPFDGQEGVQQLASRQVGVPGDGRVQKERLIVQPLAFGIGVDGGRDLEIREESSEAVYGEGDGGVAISEVAA